MLKNLYVKDLYPKDMLGSNNQFDFDEYWYLINTPTTTPGPGWTTPSPPTTKLTFHSKFFSEFWDHNGDGDMTPEELYRFKVK